MPSTPVESPDPARQRKLFDRALSLPARAREAFVRRDAADDSVLIDAVLRLLAHLVRTVQSLQTSGVGKTVNKLRKAADGKVQAGAAELLGSSRPGLETARAYARWPAAPFTCCWSPTRTAGAFAAPIRARSGSIARTACGTRA